MCPLLKVCVVIAGTCSIFTCVAPQNAAASSDWTRDLARGTSMAAFPGTSLVPLLAISEDNRVTVAFGYRYLDRVGPTQLHGKFDSAGQFWPVVTYQIAIAPNKWRTVAKSDAPPDARGIRIDPAHPKVSLEVNMNPLLSQIAKYTRCRVVLENSESATLLLDDLLPIGDDPNDSDFKAAVMDDNPRRLNSTFSLIAVTSLSNRLIGEFAFMCPDKPCSTEISGCRDGYGEFAPDVTLSAGNSTDEWKNVTMPADRKQETKLRISNQLSSPNIRVDLTDYKPLIRKVKFAKVVFSNGDFSVFEMTSLEPPFMKAPPAPAEASTP